MNATTQPSYLTDQGLRDATASLFMPSCQPQSVFGGVSFVVQCRFRPAQIPPGTPPTFHSCIIHDRQLKTLLAAMGPSRPPGGAGGAGGRGHFGAGRGNTGGSRGASLHARGSRGPSSASMLLSHCFCRSMLAQQKHVEDIDCSSQGQRITQHMPMPCCILIRAHLRAIDTNTMLFSSMNYSQFLQIHQQLDCN